MRSCARLLRVSLLQCAKEASAAHAARRTTDDTGPWIDDTAAEKKRAAELVRSPEYRELHRPALSNSSMGLFGGEPGFEKAYRVWVDPDRSHLSEMFNTSVTNKNLRFTRYGFFKRELQIIDMDKLIRHARLLPKPTTLFADMLMNKVAMPDKSCSAILRYMRDTLVKAQPTCRHHMFHDVDELVERMIVTAVPPVEFGINSHAEAIRCAAECKRWDSGWEQLRTRALEEAEQNSDMAPNSNFFDAVLFLCIKCDKTSEGMDTLRALIESNLRPRVTSLDCGMQLCAMNRDFATARELWALYDYFSLERQAASFEYYCMTCAVCDMPMEGLEALRMADSRATTLGVRCFSWLLYSVRKEPNFGDYVMELLGQLSKRGLQPDHVLLFTAWLCAAHQRDGELALAVYTQYFIHSGINMTPEMALIFLQALQRSREPNPTMLAVASEVLDRLEQAGSSLDLTQHIFPAYVGICARLGAVATSYSFLKRIVARGGTITIEIINGVLESNAAAAAPNGSASLTEELLQLRQVLGLQPTQRTIDAVKRCIASHSDEAGQTLATAKKKKKKTKGKSQSKAVKAILATPLDPLAADVEHGLMDVSPSDLRQLRVDWGIDVRDTFLKRFGQHHPFHGIKLSGAQGTNIVTPFGHIK